jgi:hypothetical protein
MGYTGYGTGVPHGIQKFLLIRARVFTRKFHLDIQGTTIRNAVTHDIALSVVTHVHETTVFREKLPDRMVPSYAAVLTEGYDYLVLKNGFGVNNRPPP